MDEQTKTTRADRMRRLADILDAAEKLAAEHVAAGEDVPREIARMLGGKRKKA